MTTGDMFFLSLATCATGRAMRQYPWQPCYPKFSSLDDFDYWVKVPKRPELDRLSKLRLAIVNDKIQRLQEQARKIEQGRG